MFYHLALANSHDWSVTLRGEVKMLLEVVSNKCASLNWDLARILEW